MRIFAGVVAIAMSLFVLLSKPAVPFFFPVIFLLIGVYMIVYGLFRR